MRSSPPEKGNREKGNPKSDLERPTNLRSFILGTPKPRTKEHERLSGRLIAEKREDGLIGAIASVGGHTVSHIGGKKWVRPRTLRIMAEGNFQAGDDCRTERRKNIYRKKPTPRCRSHKTSVLDTMP